MKHIDFHVGMKIGVSTWSFLSVIHPLQIPIPMYKKKILRFNKKIRTKLAFPPQQKTDTTAQQEKSSSSPRVASVFVPLSVILSLSKS